MPTTVLRRTWPQRLTLVLVVFAALVCFATAAGLAFGQWVLADRQLVSLAEPSSEFTEGDDTVVVPGASTTLPDADTDADAPTTTMLPLAEPDAANFLIVGADNNDCAGDVTPTVGDRDSLGERSDTIMIWRANPDTNQLAVLSLPRDLYVDIAGGRKARINSAYRRNDPTRLIDTIYLNFGIPIDHYVQVDFCAFKRLVDAVGGVGIPFEFPARDRRAGLSIEETGCVNLTGDEALAYVRSRHYQYEDPPGSDSWRTDGTSDFGRIARQQDFLRRVVTKVIDQGLYSPAVATALIDTNQQYLVTDSGLTLRRMLEFANTLQDLDPATISAYRIESTTEITSAGEEVERPRIGGDDMQAILAVFRGEAALGSTPDHDATTTTTAEPTTDTTTTVTTTTVATDDDLSDDPVTGAVPDLDGDEATTSTTVPTVTAEENLVGIIPDRAIVCD